MLRSLTAQAIPASGEWVEEYMVDVVVDDAVGEEIRSDPDASSRFFCYGRDGIVTYDRAECGDDQMTWLRVARGLPQHSGPDARASFDRAMAVATGNVLPGGRAQAVEALPSEIAQTASTAIDALLGDSTLPPKAIKELQAHAATLLDFSQRTDVTDDEIRPVLHAVHATFQDADIVPAEPASIVSVHETMINRTEQMLTKVVPESLVLLKQRNVNVSMAEQRLAEASTAFDSLASGCSGGSLQACGEVAEMLTGLTADMHTLRDTMQTELRADVFAATMAELGALARSHGAATAQ
jgi:hypothetical protein